MANFVTEHVQAEIIIKNIFGPVVRQAFRNFNRQLIQNPDNLINKFKIVIGGGEGFTYYFNRGIDIFRTHDFDTRIIYDGYIHSRTDADQVDFLIQNLQQQKQLFINYLSQMLNNYVNNNIVNNLSNTYGINMLNRTNIFFPEVVQQLLSVVSYRFTLQHENNNIQHYNSILDIIHYTERELTHYGLMNYFPSRNPVLPIEQFNLQRYDMDERFIEYSRPTNTGTSPLFIGREGYIKNYLHSDTNSIAGANYDNGNNTIIETSPYIYYITLGFLLWDTTRMLNWYVDQLFPYRTNGQPIPPGLQKYDRYIQKYIGVLTCFNRMDLYLSCDNIQIKELVRNCQGLNLDRGQFCSVDNEIFDNKDEIIDKGITDGLITANNIQDIEELKENNTFSDLCDVLQGNTSYNHPPLPMDIDDDL